jgi:hypothetical protein
MAATLFTTMFQFTPKFNTIRDSDDFVLASHWRKDAVARLYLILYTVFYHFRPTFENKPVFITVVVVIVAFLPALEPPHSPSRVEESPGKSSCFSVFVCDNRHCILLSSFARKPKFDRYGNRNKLVIATIYGIGKPQNRQIWKIAEKSIS